MMKRWWHYVVLGIAAWLLFMVWRFPASVAYGMAAQSSPQPLPVKLAGLHDTVWDGGALQLQYRDKFIANTFWQVSPWSLVVGSLDANILLLNIDADLEARVVMPLGGGEIAFSDIKGRLPLSLLQQHLTMIPVPLKGNLSLKLDELQLNAEGRPKRAEGRVVWHGAGVQMNEVVPLGDLQVKLESREEGGILGTINDSGGPLQLSATLNLKPDGSYSLSGNVTPNDATPDSLRGMLPMLGQPDSQGGYPLNFSGRL